MDLHAADVLRTPRGRCLRLGTLVFFAVACGLLLASLLSSGAASADPPAAPASLVLMNHS